MVHGVRLEISQVSNFTWPRSVFRPEFAFQAGVKWNFCFHAICACTEW